MEPIQQGVQRQGIKQPNYSQILTGVLGTFEKRNFPNKKQLEDQVSHLRRQYENISKGFNDYIRYHKGHVENISKDITALSNEVLSFKQILITQYNSLAEEITELTDDDIAAYVAGLFDTMQFILLCIAKTEDEYKTYLQIIVEQISFIITEFERTKMETLNNFKFSLGDEAPNIQVKVNHGNIRQLIGGVINTDDYPYRDLKDAKYPEPMRILKAVFSDLFAQGLTKLRTPGPTFDFFSKLSKFQFNGNVEGTYLFWFVDLFPFNNIKSTEELNKVFGNITGLVDEFINHELRNYNYKILIEGKDLTFKNIFYYAVPPNF